MNERADNKIGEKTEDKKQSAFKIFTLKTFQMGVECLFVTYQ